MNEFLSVGLVLMAALLAGHVAQLVRIPEVTGYLVMGLVIGPSALDLISHENIRTLGFLSDIALGLILFNIGAIFEASQFRRVGRGVVRVTLYEATLAFVLVFVVALISGMSLPVALLLAVVAMETAPATTLMVLNEYDAEGPLTSRLLALVALNNMYVLVTFGVVSTALLLFATPGPSWIWSGYQAFHGLLWSTLGSVALGALLGLLMDAWAARARESGEAMILSIGAVLIGVGASQWLGLSSLIVTLALGATVANASRRGDHLLRALGRIDPPFYAAFFVLAGAELVPSSVLGLGLLGIGYIVARAAGKIAGARFALRGQDVSDVVRRQLGYCLVSSSSLAVGLTIQIRQSFPDHAPTITGVVLAAVVVFEVVGPLLTRRALFATGEAKTVPAPLVPTEVNAEL
ncbi:MAG TPA: cation:proton antiporter [Vicinamibacterales bacterium]|nr:cation:proton antiporter [Vicinamibacterales bacterium]